MSIKLYPPKIIGFVADGRSFQIECEIDRLCCERDAAEWEESDKLYQSRLFLEEEQITLEDLEEIERAGKIRVKLIQEEIEELKKLL